MRKTERSNEPIFVEEPARHACAHGNAGDLSTSTRRTCGLRRPLGRSQLADGRSLRCIASDESELEGVPVSGYYGCLRAHALFSWIHRLIFLDACTYADVHQVGPVEAHSSFPPRGGSTCRVNRSRRWPRCLQCDIGGLLAISACRLVLHRPTPNGQRAEGRGDTRCGTLNWMGGG